MADEGFATGSSMIGRDAELATVRTFLRGPGRTGGALVFSGEAGMGKTALLEAAVTDAKAAGFRVLRVSGAEFEGSISFAGLHQLLYPILDRVAALPSDQRDALSAALGLAKAEPPGPLVLVNAVLAILSEYASDRPVLVAVDDLPWLDRPTVVTLSVVARRLGGTSIGLLAVSRTDADGYFDRTGLPELEVPPLNERAADNLLVDRFPAMARHARRRLVQEAQGNPLALLELPVALSGAQITDDGSLPSVLPMTRRLLAMFEERIVALPPSTRELLLLAVLDGSGMMAPMRLVRGPEVFAELAPAEHARLVDLDSGSGRLSFRHPLVRAAVAAMSTGEQQRQAHLALAAAHRDSPERRAWHLAQATPGPDEAVAGMLEEAARLVGGRGDAAGAVTTLLRAVDLSPPGPQRSRRLAEAAYLGAVATGELRRVPALLEDARRSEPGVGGSLAAAVAATHHLLLSGDGDIDTIHRMLSAAIESQPEPYDATDRLIVEALYTLAWVCYFGGRAELWTTFHRAVAKLTPDVPLSVTLVADTFADPARITPTALARLDAAVAALPAETDGIAIARTSLACMFVDRLPACRGPLRQLRERARHSGGVTLSLHTLSLLGLDGLMAGEWTTIAALADEHLQLCEAHNYQTLKALSLWMQAMTAAGRGDKATVTARTDQMTRWAAPRGVELVRRLAAQARTLAALGSGEFEEAYRFASSISPAGELASHVPHAVWMVLDLVEAAVRTGRVDDAAAHVAAAQAAELDRISPRLALIVEGAAAVASPGNEGIERFRRALAVPGADRWQFDYARIQLAYGERLRRRKITVEARTQLGAALETFTRVGAEPWAVRARNEIRATGLVAPRADEPPAALTPQQMQIAALAAQGLTNKQIGERLFLSPRTVGTHLYQIFPKLGITSRAALRDALEQQYESPA
jgi:DNA-binding CsgD family transcriptional regulator